MRARHFVLFAFLTLSFTGCDDGRDETDAGPGMDGGGGCRSNADCDDEIGCTLDTCGIGGVCMAAALDERCGDGETCNPTMGCLGTETCGSDDECDDGVECTVDTCAVGGVCAFNALDALCGDGVCDRTEGCVAAPDAGDTDAGPGADAGPGSDGGPGDTDGGPIGGCGALTLCSGRCVDISTDEDACGSCVNSCSPGQACVGGSCVSGVTGLVISEIHYFPTPYFELYNGGSTAVDLAGYQVQWATGSTTGNATLPTFSLGAGEFVTLRDTTVTAGDHELSLGAPIVATTQIAVQVLAPAGLALDYVRTGDASFPPGTGTTWTGDDAANPSLTVDQALVRNVFVADSDSAADWRLENLGSPGDYCRIPGRCGDACVDFGSDRGNCGGCGVGCAGTQICRDGTCTAAFGGAWLSEYRRTPTAGLEIHNPTGSPIVLTGWSVEVISATGTGAYEIGAITLEPGEFLWLYAGSGIDDARVLFTGIPAARFAGDVALALLDDAGQGVDFARFGGSTAPAPSGTVWAGDNVTIFGGSELSARRNLARIDTNSASDWVIDGPSTPGFLCWAGQTTCSGYCVDQAVDPAHCGGCGTACDANESCVEGVCSTVGAVVLSELVNRSPERFEVFNGTDAAVDLDGWSIQWTADGGSGTYTVSGTTTLAPGEVQTFAETIVTGAINMATAINWTSDIAVTLRNASGDAVDFVKTGSSGTSAPAGTTWAGAPAATPSDTDAERLERARWAPDTDSAADWSVAPGVAAASLVCESTAQSVCGGECVPFPSTDDCGACGNVCPAGTVCAAGVCDLEEGALRIVESGVLQMFFDGAWRAVCDDGFDNHNAAVACRQLGYAGGTVDLGTPAATVHQHYWNCAAGGPEARLADCGFVLTSCSSAETVGLNCF